MQDRIQAGQVNKDDELLVIPVFLEVLVTCSPRMSLRHMFATCSLHQHMDNESRLRRSNIRCRDLLQLVGRDVPSVLTHQQGGQPGALFQQRKCTEEIFEMLEALTWDPPTVECKERDNRPININTIRRNSGWRLSPDRETTAQKNRI